MSNADALVNLPVIIPDIPNRMEIIALIQGLVEEKQTLEKALEKERLRLKQRSHELSVIYSTSSAMNYSLSSPEIVTIITTSLYSVMKYDMCAAFLQGFNDGGSLYLRISPYLDNDFIEHVTHNVYHTIESFTQAPVKQEDVNILREDMGRHESVDISSVPQEINSFVNIPVSFKKEVMGLISLSSVREKAFSREKINFAFALVNQMATILGRLRQLIENEKQRINHIVENLQDSVIILDNNRNPITLNKEARLLFECDNTSTLQDIKNVLNDYRVLALLDSINIGELKGSSQELNIIKNNEERTFLVNIDLILGANSSFFSGYALILRDISYLKRIEKEKSKKIAIINKARELINSMANQEKLFSILGDYILYVANAHMGSLSLIEKNKLDTKSSWVLPSKESPSYISQFEANFPESVDFIDLDDGENLLKRTIHTKQTVIIRDFTVKSSFLMDMADSSDTVDIVLKEIVAIPLQTKKDVIGILTVIRKEEPDVPYLTRDDVETLETIASLAATAIENAALYQKSLTEQKIQQELKLAHEIQRRILPKKLPLTSNFEYGGISIPAHGIGGDYYDFFQISRLGKELLGIAIIDVVGKGIPAALITIMIKSILQTHTMGKDSPKDVLSSINSAVLNEPAITKFVPMFYCVIDDATRTLRYTNAGHERPLLFSARSNGFQVLDTEGFPVGGLPEAGYEENTVQLQPGDIVSMSTDGIVEARDPQGNAFGDERLKTLIKRYKHLPANKLVDKIYTHVIEFVKDAPQHDDLTLVIVKAKDHRNAGPNRAAKVLWHQELDITSSTKHVKTVRDVVEEAATKLGFDASAIYDLKLAVNEAQANIIKHAYGKDPDQPIVFKVTVYEDRIDFYFKDYGKTCGELAIKQVRSLDDFQGNGLGVFLIKSTMDDVTYDIVPGERTELTMIKYKDEPLDNLLENN